MGFVYAIESSFSVDVVDELPCIEPVVGFFELLVSVERLNDFPALTEAHVASLCRTGCNHLEVLFHACRQRGLRSPSRCFGGVVRWSVGRTSGLIYGITCR